MGEKIAIISMELFLFYFHNLTVPRQRIH